MARTRTRTALALLLSPDGTVEGLGEHNEVKLLPGSAHAQNIFDTAQSGPALDAILARLREFATR